MNGPRALNKNALADFRGRERSPVGGAGASNMEGFLTGAQLLSPEPQALAPETGSPLPCRKIFCPGPGFPAGNRPEIENLAGANEARKIAPARPRGRKIP